MPVRRSSCKEVSNMLKYCQAEHCVLTVPLCCQCNRCKGDCGCVPLRHKAPGTGNVIIYNYYCYLFIAITTVITMISLQTELLHRSTDSMQQMGCSINTTLSFGSPDCQYLPKSVLILPALHCRSSGCINAAYWSEMRLQADQSIVYIS